MLKNIKLNEKAINTIKEGLNKISEPEVKLFCITDEYPEAMDIMIHNLKYGFNHMVAPVNVKMNDEQIEFIQAMFLNTDKENLVNKFLN